MKLRQSARLIGGQIKGRGDGRFPPYVMRVSGRGSNGGIAGRTSAIYLTDPMRRRGYAGSKFGAAPGSTIRWRAENVNQIAFRIADHRRSAARC